MPSETPFRIALTVVLLFTMTVTVYYRRRAAASGERISHQEEGLVFAAALRLAGLVLWIATFAYLLFPATVRWGEMPLPEGVRWLGAITGVVCSWLMYWTLSSLGKNLTDTVVTRADAHLVTDGPYRWVRHPFYVTAGLLIFSATLLTAQWPIGLSGLLILILLAVRTPKEEQMLVNRFGDAYREYQAITGRFFPRLLR